jgi:hypothetical protein
MVKRTILNNILFGLSKLSPLLLTTLIIILFIKNDKKTVFYLAIILLLSFLFERYEKHHVIPIVAFYLFHTLQVWFITLLDVVVEFIGYAP